MIVLVNGRKCLKGKDYRTRYDILILMGCFLFPISITAGPPFRTDDPEPVEYHHWEFYLASQIANANEGLSGTVPQVEINYGIFQETQIHLIVPLSFNRSGTSAFAYGPGDIELGLKYRFFNETPFIPQVGLFPLAEIPTGNAAKGLGEGNAQVFFPLWAQKNWGSWTTYGGGGYLVNIRPEPVNSWFAGWEVQHDFSELITLGEEVFGTFYPTSSTANELAFNIGAIINFSDNHHVLLSTGRDIIGHDDLFLYAAYQLTIGPGSR